jgi:hypothetical protein
MQQSTKIRICYRGASDAATSDAPEARSRRRLSSRMQAGLARASICIQAISSQAIVTSSHQICSGRSVQGPGCAAGCAWRRGIRALAAGPAVVPQLKVGELPAPGVGGKHVNRCPPRSVNSNCAPGRFLRTMTRIPSGRSARFSRPVSPATQAPAAHARRRNRPTPRAGCGMEEDGLAGRRHKGQASRVPHLVPGLCEPERLNTELSADLPDLDRTCVDENQADGRANRRISRGLPVRVGHTL